MERGNWEPEAGCAALDAGNSMLGSRCWDLDAGRSMLMNQEGSAPRAAGSGTGSGAAAAGRGARPAPTRLNSITMTVVNASLLFLTVVPPFPPAQVITKAHPQGPSGNVCGRPLLDYSGRTVKTACAIGTARAGNRIILASGYQSGVFGASFERLFSARRSLLSCTTLLAVWILAYGQQGRQRGTAMDASRTMRCQAPPNPRCMVPELHVEQWRSRDQSRDPWIT